jgi:hypothetical protein
VAKFLGWSPNLWTWPDAPEAFPMGWRPFVKLVDHGTDLTAENAAVKKLEAEMPIVNDCLTDPAFPRPPASPISAASVVGTWRLVSNEEHQGDGVVRPVWERPGGRLVYDASSRMAMQLGDLGRRPFASDDRLAGTPDEMRRAFETYISYFGSYTIDASGGVIVHRVEASLFPNLMGLDQRRFFVLSGNRLTLTTPPILGGGRRSTYVLVWEREQ